MRRRASHGLDWVAALVAVLDVRGRIVLWNRACEEALGYTRRDVLGRTLWDVLAGSADDSEIRGAVARLRQGAQRTRFESICIGGYGRRCVIAWYQEARRDAHGNLESIVVTGVDITEQRRAVSALQLVAGRLEDMRAREVLLAQEHEARRSAELERSRLDAILQNAPTGMLYIEAGSEQVIANAALGRLIQRPIRTERGSGHCLGELRHPHGEVIAPERMPWLRALGGETVVAEQLCVEQPMGGSVQLIVHVSPVFGGAGEISGAVASFQDISARYQLEQLQRDYVCLVSHDLGGPLNAMSMGVQLLQEMLAGRPASTEANIVRRIEQSCQVMRSMIDDLVEVGRLESGRLEPRWARVDLQALVEDALDSSLSEQERGRVRVARSQVLSPVLLDGQRMSRVIINLVANALKYSPAGSLVKVDLEAREGRAVISVQDHGPGIEPGDAARLFEKHYRADTASEMQMAGAGLGLYICRLIVDAHGGDIRVESTPGQGATFRVFLPMREPAADSEG